MIDFIIGMVVTAILFCSHFYFYSLGKSKNTPTSNDYYLKEVKKRDKGMQNIMDYDVDVAMGKRTQRGDE